MKFGDLKVGDSFTIEDDGGLFTKTSSQSVDNAVVVISADVASPVGRGITTNFYSGSIVLPVTKITFTYQIIETKTVTKEL